MSDDSFFREIQIEFLTEVSENLAQAESLFLSLEKPNIDHKSNLSQLKRLAHNFKGSGKAVGFDELSSFSHIMENLLIALDNGTVNMTPTVIDLLLQCNDTLKNDLLILTNDPKAVLNHKALEEKLIHATNNPQDEVIEIKSVRPSAAASAEAPPAAIANSDSFIRIPMKKIDDLLNSFGEQVIFLSALDLYKDDLNRHQEEIVRTILNLKKIALDLQQSTLSLRMVSLKGLFSKLERVVRDSARETNKKIMCEVYGADAELDKAIVDQLSDPLTHMVRNAVDHGIEEPTARDQMGKIDTGIITLKAIREAGNFIIEIRDDGKGLDPERIRRKAIEKGIISENAVLSNKEIFDLIFENNFSTKDQVSELSGRGVGMNVVKQMIHAMKGTYEIESELGLGTCFRLKLPLSLSLYNGLAINIGKEKFIVPCSQIQEIVQSSHVEFLEVKTGVQIIKLRDEIFEFHNLTNILGFEKSKVTGKTENQSVLICHFDGRKLAFGISKVLGIHRVVQKKLSPEMKSCPGAAGVTIQGDGLPAIILDLNSLSQDLTPLMAERAV